MNTNFQKNLNDLKEAYADYGVNFIKVRFYDKKAIYQDPEVLNEKDVNACFAQALDPVEIWNQALNCWRNEGRKLGTEYKSGKVMMICGWSLMSEEERTMHKNLREFGII